MITMTISISIWKQLASLKTTGHWLTRQRPENNESSVVRANIQKILTNELLWYGKSIIFVDNFLNFHSYVSSLEGILQVWEWWAEWTHDK
jgi:hypothetical protein